MGESPAVTRRGLVKRAAGLAALGPLVARPGVAAAAPSSRRKRVAIVGAGAGGVAAAYFLGDTHDVEVFEARSKIGGHCDSRAIEYRGHRIVVDIGAQFFHPGTHPLYVTLLRQLGLYDPAHPATDDTVDPAASLCIFPTGSGAPVFSSTHALATPSVAGEFATFTGLARKAILGALRWETTVEAWVASLPLSAGFKRDVLLPWITALIGSSRALALKASARSILQTFALSFPADLTKPATTYNSTIGLQGNLERMLRLTPSARVHVNAPVGSLRRLRAGWCLQTPHGTHGPYEAVVLNAPASVGHALLRRVSGFSDVAALLGRYEYFTSRLLIHTDPAYVERDRSNWASYNAEIRGSESEGSAWYGALHSKLPSGATVDVFKSWATRRAADPEHILAERTFQHPAINQTAIRAARGLRRFQGRGGLYFSGQYTTGFDAQESAVYSALKVGEALAPSSRTVRALNGRLRAAGLGRVTYDL